MEITHKQQTEVNLQIQEIENKTMEKMTLRGNKKLPGINKNSKLALTSNN